MTQHDRLGNIENLFHRARVLPEAERESFLREECQGDTDLHEEVAKLLSHYQEETGEERTSIGSPDTRSLIPEHIGPFRVLRLLGEGGMGVVYLAEQTEPVRRRVALKVIKLGMDTKALLARFEKERQTLAIMQHDGIARVFDCGVTDRGQPYISMEWVKGDPLTSYCEHQRLSLTARVQLVQQICAAVQHAHQKGVVHRDLTPRNVLVFDEGGQAKIKIIDFGLAKAMGPSIGADSLVSDLRVVLGTPGYMAPEQADPTNADIDTRADIYSIGVILYELLVGTLPFENLHERGILDMQRVLSESDPQRPSTRFGSHQISTTHIEAITGTSSGALLKALRQDLDWIILKAIDKSPDRRYDSANALAADLQCFLDDEPVSAGPPSVRYLLGKALRKHRRVMMVVALLFVTLTAGLSIALWQYGVAKDAQASSEEAWARHGTLSNLIDLTTGLAEEAEFIEHKDDADRMREWIRKADAIRINITQYRAERDRLSALRTTGATGLEFDNPSDRIQFEVYDKLIKSMEGPGKTAYDRVESSLDWTQRVGEETVDKHAKAWAAAIERVSKDTRFAALEDFQAQEGLVPLGPNKATNLEEFWMPRTGLRPQRNEDGFMMVTPDSGIVLVLLPGGTVSIGTRNVDQGADPDFTFDNERPRHTVTLAPFFIGKWELTQGQWRRPQFAGKVASENGREGTEHHPVENISYVEAELQLRRHRLLLPTEAQWEYACRAGTTSYWWCADSLMELRQPDDLWQINVASKGGPNGWIAQGVQDQWPVHAPVGWCKQNKLTHRFRPNAFGLWHMLGNIAELTRGYAVKSFVGVIHAPVDGEITNKPADPRRELNATLRGGSYTRSAYQSRSATRAYVRKDSKIHSGGIRVSRKVF